MLIGVLADIHDHLDHLREAIRRFNASGCELVLFAGDLVSTFAIPPLRRLHCPMIGCFGDNEGNKVGIYGGMQIVGTMAEPPLGIRLPDGTRVLLTHQWELLRGDTCGSDVVVYAHTHRPRIDVDAEGRLLLNPGETSGWTYRRPTIALLETGGARPRAEILDLLPGENESRS